MHAATDDALGGVMAPVAGRGRGRASSWVLALDRHFGNAIEAVAAALIVAEIVILFMGVISRYFLQTPLVCSDEVACCSSCGWSAWGRWLPSATASTCA